MTAPRFMLCVDPGKSSAGVALFRDEKLQSATCLRLGKDASTDITARAVALAEVIYAWSRRIMVDTWGGGSYLTPDMSELIVECPQVYTRGKSKGDPEDLLPLVALCGALGARFQHAHHDPIVLQTYRPRDWKGTVDGDIMCARIEARLRETGELDAVRERTKTFRHNAIDACGIGLYRLGRLNRERVFPGAT